MNQSTSSSHLPPSTTNLVRRRKLSSEQEAEVCRRYQDGESFRAIGEALGVSLDPIAAALDRRGVKRRPAGGSNRSLTPQQEDELCQRFQVGQKVSILCARFGVSSSKVYDLLKRRGISKRHNGFTAAQQAEARDRYYGSADAENCTPAIPENRGKYACDHTFFDVIDTEAKAYWLGFIAADGGVYRNTLHVRLSSRERGHLLRLKAALASDHPLQDLSPNKHPDAMPGSGPMSHLAVNSKQLVRGLARHGIVPKKTFKIRWPHFLPDHLLRHYLRGYSDGDGCFYVNTKNNTRSPQPQWFIVGTHDLCLGAQGFLIRAGGLTKTKLVPHESSGGIYLLRYGGVLQTSRVWKLLYDDAAVYLPRKKGVVEPYVRTERRDNAVATLELPNLRALRKERGLSQKELAAMAGVGTNNLSRLETGHRLASPSILRKLAAALSVEPSELVKVR